MAVEYDGELGRQLAEQPGGMEPHRVGDDLDDAPVADLEAVAERAVDDVAPPVLCQAVDVGELVHQPVAASTRRATMEWPPTNSTRKRPSSVRVTR